MAANIEIRPVPPAERAAWEPLWKGYLDFYKTSVPKEVYDTTWARLHDPAEPMRLLGAYVDGRLLGIVHFIYHRSCWTIADYCYLQDLFVAHDARNLGLGRAPGDPALTLNLALSTGGRLFHRAPDGRWAIRFEAADAVVPRTVHDQVAEDHSASAATLNMGGSDTLPGFFAGKYAMVPLGFSYRQQVVQQAPKGFHWQVLPAPAGL